MVKCPYCNTHAKLVGGDVIYPHRSDLSALKFYQCAPCDAYVGTHKGGAGHPPLGRLANANLRRLKVRCHSLFDPLWKQALMSRSEAYRRLAKALNIPKEECHIGMFDEGRCMMAITAICDGALEGPQ